MENQNPEQNRETNFTEITGNSNWRLGKDGPSIGIYEDESSSTGYLLKGPLSDIPSGFVELPLGITSVGREADIRLDAPQTISRVHLKINNKGDSYDVIDCSLNGTFRIEG